MVTSMAALQHPPAAPGPLAEPVYCRCNAGATKIGQIDGEWLFVAHRGRLVTARLPATIQCDRCGRRTLVLDGNTSVD